MNYTLEQLDREVHNETIKKWKVLKENYSFKNKCNSLIKMLDQAKLQYDGNRIAIAYIQYMTVVNIYQDKLNTLKDFNKNLPEYSILKRELSMALDTIENIKTTIKENEKNLPSNGTNSEVASPSLNPKTTINSERLFKYVTRIISGKEANPPQILLIDIRGRKEYEENHIYWTQNPKYRYNGVVNIPLDFFYGVNMDIKGLINRAVFEEKDEQQKNLIKSIFESDLIVIYDKDGSQVVKNQYQIISDLLFHNNNNLKIKRPPVILENGYNGWVQFIQKTGRNISEWTKSNSINDSIDFVTRKIVNMNMNPSNQNINEVNKDKINTYSNEALNNNYYMQYANIPQSFNNSYSQSQPLMQAPNVVNYNTPLKMNSSNDLYSNINLEPNTPSAPAINTYATAPSYPQINEYESAPPVPAKPSQINYNQPPPNQNQYNYNVPTYQNINNYNNPYPIQPQPIQSQPIQPQPIQSQPIQPNQLPSIPNRQMNTPQVSYPATTPTSVDPPPKIPPKIPERNGSLTRLSSSSSVESLKNIPAVPPKPMSREYSLNEIHNSNHGYAGLKNLGNTCYMNSILQCLSATSQLTRYFLSGTYRRDINETNTLGTKGKLAKEYYSFLNSIWTEHRPVVSPTNIKCEISRFNDEFSGSDQHDSQEFLSCILDGLHEDLNVARKKDKNEIEYIRQRHNKEEKDEENQHFEIKTLQDRAWKRYLDFNYSVIVTTFQGQYMSILKCSRCGMTSPSFNSLMYLSVPIPKGATNLYQCLDKYIEIEHLNGEDGWNCPRCKMKVDTQKQLVLSRLPKIMLIHLKRFYFQGPFKDKIDTNIDFPLENLDLSKYTYKFKDSNENKYTYNLFAISNHYGTLSGGHYTAFIKNKAANKWISFDDSRYSDIDTSQIKTQAAYILFYERIE